MSNYKDSHKCVNQPLQFELDQISEKCKSCKICLKECAFLRKHGTPKKIADKFNFTAAEDSLMAYQCSLCQLCTAVCPFDADPKAMFLEMRRYAHENGWGELPQHNRLLNFEKLGTSKLFSLYALPPGCKTVLFPGCSLSASRSSIVKELYSHLKEKHGSLGLVLDCCTKPSHDLGRHRHFLSMFTELTGFLAQKGVTRVLVACPSCHSVFKTYAKGFETRTVYEELVDVGPPEDSKRGRGKASFHDSCTTRFEGNIHESVRKLSSLMGVEIKEMEHHSRKAICCGEGGGACFIAPELISTWKDTRVKETETVQVLTYCAGCANFIGKKRATHLLDLIFSPMVRKGKKPNVAKAPFTYLHRLALKRWAKKNIMTKRCKERSTPVTR